MFQIVRREQLSASAFLWDVFAPDVARAAQAGQFVMIRLHEGGERIPLTVADADPRRGTVTLVIQALGRTTREMSSNYAVGDWFTDFVGPLGVPSELDVRGHVVVIGGGLGVAPIFPQALALVQAGARVTAVLGFRTSDQVFWLDRFDEAGAAVVVCTEDGSQGREGRVTAALGDLLEQDPPSLVIAVGPLPMMAAVAEVTRPAGVRTIVSLNAIMVDGTGMCGSCRVTVGGQIRFACVDGPDFDAHAVAFDELLNRQRRFRREESTASQDAEHVCNLEQALIVEGRRNYKKLKQISAVATPMPERDPFDRSHTMDEVNLGYSLPDALIEAERCLQCVRPTCVSGCPVSIDIPGFIRHLLVRDLEGARTVIEASNLFPSVCGRVCPQESQCEAQCILTRRMEPVAIGRLERYVGDHAPRRPPPPPPTDGPRGRVAIVGSGPSGLAAAADLARQGVEVTVFEALHVVGGVLQYGIPAFRLPRDVIATEVDALRALGVRFETNKVIGRVHTVDQLLDAQDAAFDAVYVATGAGYPAFLGLPGESAGQVYSANEFLTRVNLMGGDRFPLQDTPIAVGTRVAVIGAGNTAMDCTRVARRLGVAEVRCVYRRTEAEAPARREELRHAGEEGVSFHFLRSPTEILVNDAGDIEGLVVQVMQLGAPDASGRRRPEPVEGATEVLPCDTVIYALGTRANPIIGQTTPDLELDRRGYIAADPATQATNKPGVFAGGDIVTGGATVILAMGAGRRAARAIATWLTERSWPPVATDAPAPLTTDPTCPRCHRPVDADDAYVCCADEQLQWQCGGCAKLYEGFAMPYGLCPACGGALALRDASKHDDHAAIRQAVAIELGGRALYRGAASRATDPELRALFSRLAEMEDEHLALLRRRYHLGAEEPAEPAPEQLAVYAGVDPDVGSTEALLELALTLERRARDFFAGHVREHADGSPAWKLYRELEAEEYEHVAILETELERLRAGRPGQLVAP